jgi:hypothetical protein
MINIFFAHIVERVFTWLGLLTRDWLARAHYDVFARHAWINTCLHGMP